MRNRGEDFAGCAAMKLMRGRGIIVTGGRDKGGLFGPLSFEQISVPRRKPGSRGVVSNAWLLPALGPGFRRGTGGTGIERGRGDSVAGVTAREGWPQALTSAARSAPPSALRAATSPWPSATGRIWCGALSSLCPKGMGRGTASAGRGGGAATGAPMPLRQRLAPLPPPHRKSMGRRCWPLTSYVALKSIAIPAPRLPCRRSGQASRG